MLRQIGIACRTARRAPPRARARRAACGTLRTPSGAPAGSGPVDGCAIEIAFARHRALAADVERLERVDLSRVRDADAHAELLLHARIRNRRLHAPELERQARCTALRFGKDARDRHRLRRKRDRRAGADRALRGRNRLAVRRHERGADAVVGLGAVDVRLDDLSAGGLAGLDRPVNVFDRRFFDLKRLGRCGSRREQERQCQARENGSADAAHAAVLRARTIPHRAGARSRTRGRGAAPPP